MVEVERHLWRPPGPTTLVKQGHLQPAAQDHVQMFFLRSLGMETPQPLWTACCSAHSEKLFPYVQREPPVSQFVLFTSCPVTEHQWKEPGSVFTASLQAFIYSDKITPWAFSSLGKKVPGLSDFSHMRELKLHNSARWLADSYVTSNWNKFVFKNMINS